VSAILVATLLASLAGSLHCVGMCGPFVAFYSAADAGESSRRARLLAHVAYAGARLLVYVLLGVLAGALGAGLDRAGASLLAVQRGAAIVAGATMVGWGALGLATAFGLRWSTAGREPGRLRALVAALIRRVRSRPPAVRAATMGLLAPLLPCGWLYAFVVAAATTGSASRGALLMAAFWLGSVPALAGLGAALGFLSAPLRRRLPVLTAAVVLVVGLLALTGRAGLEPPATGSLHAPAAPAAVRGLTLERSCCRRGR
jgi:hypothetical protein